MSVIKVYIRVCACVCCVVLTYFWDSHKRLYVFVLPSFPPKWLRVLAKFGNQIFFTFMSL